MNTIKELIEKYCPNGVEYKKLGEVAEIVGGRDYKHLSPGNIPVYGSGGVMTYVDDYAYNQPTVLLPRKGSISNVFYVDKPFWNVDTIFYTKIKDYLLPKYLYYYICNCHIEKLNTSNAARPALTRTVLNNILIPVPPLPVQREIVRILDSFTSLEAELEAELEARRKQYEYYRDQLLSFKHLSGGGKNEVEWKTLGEIMNISRGASPRPIQRYITDDPNGINWIKIGDVSENAKYIKSTKERITKEGAQRSHLLHKGDFILSNSMSFGRPYILDIDGCIHDGWISMSGFTNLLLPDFLYHILKSRNVQKYWKQKASTGAVSNLNADIVRGTIIPIPSKKQQQDIVSILDRFESLVNDISTGLPAEIAARHQQYEYYRDQLLSFKRKS